jgi:HD-like signal output (HDOD) protein
MCVDNELGRANALSQCGHWSFFCRWETVCFEIATDRAYTAALIHDVGRLGLLQAYGELYMPVFATRHNTMAECLEFERRLFEMDHCQAGLLLTQRWGFPSDYSRVAGLPVHDRRTNALRRPGRYAIAG